MEVVKKEKYKSYDFKFKLNVVKTAKQIGNRAAAREFNVDEKQVRTWRKQESTLIKCMNEKLRNNEQTTRKRLPGAGRRLISDELDSVIFYWILEQREKSIKVSRHNIQEKALELFRILNKKPDKNFKASNGWLQKFMERNQLSLRPTKTNLKTQTNDDNDLSVIKNDINTKIINYLINLSKLRLTEDNSLLKDDQIIAMNEIRLFYEIVSLKDSNVKFENEKEYVTIVLAAKANGKKLKPYVVFKSSEWDVKVLTQKFSPDKVVLRSSKNGWMNQELIHDWLKIVYGKLKYYQRLLIWDSYRYHITTDTIHELRMDYNTKMAVIPTGCTKLIQPADTSWNTFFKDAIIKFYENWMSGFLRDDSFVYDGCLKVRSKDMILKWIIDAWDLLSSDIIVNSFKSCGINVNPDGNEDGLINCFKVGQPCFDSKELLYAARLNRNDFGREEFVLEEDLDEIEENEILIECDEDWEMDEEDDVEDMKEEQIILHIHSDSSDSDL